MLHLRYRIVKIAPLYADTYACQSSGLSMKLTLRFALVLSLMALLLSACAAENAGDPADSVEAYLTAMSEGDPDAMVVVSCADWETQARLSADAYIAVETTLND